MFGVGSTELMIIGFVGILLFGNRLPKLMRDLGRSLTEFKRGMHDDPEPTELPRELPPSQ